MKIKIAKKAGFCMGVRRAVNLVLKALNKGCFPLYTYGPLIHNPQTLEFLSTLGVKTLKHLEEALDENLPSGTVIIRAHGIPPKEKEILSKKHKIIDGTCPRVSKVQTLAKKAVSEGKYVIIIGDKDHAEVRGILGYCEGKGFVISEEREVTTLPPLKNYVILSQTTQDEKLFKKISEKILTLYPEGEVINTICNATEVRQNEVRNLCKDCSGIIVIGGKFSANTKRLAEIAKKEGKEVFLVEKPEELPLQRLKELKQIGITAGASTPNWLINEIVDLLKTKSSLAYKFLKFLSFLSLIHTLNFTLLLGGFLNSINHPLNLSYLFLIGFFFFFCLTNYQVRTYLEKDTYRFYFPTKFKFLQSYQNLTKLMIGFFGFLSLISAIFYNPKILILGFSLSILNLIFIKTVFSFFWEFILLVGIAFYLFPLWNVEFSLSFLFVVLLLIYIKLYFETIYFQTDGFLPKNFLILNFSDPYKTVFRILNIILILKCFIIILLCYFNLKYALVSSIVLLCYFINILLQRRPLGQIIYMETLTLIISLLFFIITFLTKDF